MKKGEVSLIFQKIAYIVSTAFSVALFPNSSPNPFSCKEKGNWGGVVIPLYFQERGNEGVNY
jgi:hypothetical protein